jgi:diguanylate cyclase (GGDEF)-like protein
MEEFFKQEIHRAYRKGTSIGVIIIDIDHFKRVNDTLGHDTGDMLLGKIGKFFQRSIRESDIVCRFGGEEFVIIMPEATVEIAAGRAQELRKSFKLTNLDYESLSPVGEITISLGVSAFPRNGLTAEAIFKAADDALYEAKDSGRDRVGVARVRENNPAVNSGPLI